MLTEIIAFLTIYHPYLSKFALFLIYAKILGRNTTILKIFRLLLRLYAKNLLVVSNDDNVQIELIISILIYVGVALEI